MKKQRLAVLGSTEYGTIDPVDAVVDARDAALVRGLGFGVHVDAAWRAILIASRSSR